MNICDRCGKNIKLADRYPCMSNGLDRSMLIKEEMFRYWKCVHMCGKCKASFVSWWNQEEGAE